MYHRVLVAAFLVSTVPSLAAPAPRERPTLVGKWAGVASLGGTRFDINYTFRADGQGILKILENTYPIRYRVLPKGKLQLEVSDGRGGWLPSALIPFRVKGQALHLDFLKSDYFEWPKEFRRTR